MNIMRMLKLIGVMSVFSTNFLCAKDLRSLSTPWVTLKVDRDVAGSIVWLSDDQEDDDANLLNSHDPGRYIQQSFYGYSFNDRGVYPDYRWNDVFNWNWNPVEGATWNDKRNQNFRIVSESYSNDRIYVKAVAASWGSLSSRDANDDVDHVTFEKDVRIKYDVVKVVFTVRVGSGASGCVDLNNAGHEMPAMYFNSYYLDNIVGDKIKTVKESDYSKITPKDPPEHQDIGAGSSFKWLAILDNVGGYGLGIKPDSKIHKIKYFKQPGGTRKDGNCDGCSHIALQHDMKFKDQNGFSLSYTLYLVPGTQSYIEDRIDEIGRVGFNNLSYPVKRPDESPVLNAAFYLGNHSDLRKAYGETNYNAAINHWYEFVENENKPYDCEYGRRGHENFQVHYYRYHSHNDDLNRLYGNEWYRYFKHYKIFGINEGRPSAP